MVTAERLEFNSNFQHEGEFVTIFSVKFRHLEASCDFRTFLYDALQECFVVGLCDRAAQADLLKRGTLTFESACNIVKWRESQEFQPSSVQPVNTVGR